MWTSGKQAYPDRKIQSPRSRQTKWVSEFDWVPHTPKLSRIYAMNSELRLSHDITMSEEKPERMLSIVLLDRCSVSSVDFESHYGRL